MLPTLLAAALPLLVSGSPAKRATVPSELFAKEIPAKVSATASSVMDTAPNFSYPHTTSSNSGVWQLEVADWWTSGFFPATAYLVNARAELCGATADNGLDAADWLALGRAMSAGLAPLEDHTTQGHDVGFLSFPFIEELKVNPDNETAKTGVNKFANALAARFNPTVGCTRSWDSSDADEFQVIIDNMMNLEVLFQSAALTGNDTLVDIAISHANTTMANHIREDGGTWHVIVYSASTGEVTAKHTAQGYSDDSTWSRGQAWAIYGFANMYAHTGITDYLTTARRLADYFISNIPSDGIVPWDFNAPTADRPADTSAATTASTGLLLLSQHETDDSLASKYSDAAIQILSDTTAFAWQPSWNSILSNGTVNVPQGNSRTGIVYGDYYYILAGTELVNMGLASC
ncbi:glycoside hydrolase family 88 protein [Schizophyllum amplum]|uniref:Glycoside hydrolase family 88 protein n=1 Tax=Schizophyllum amplum TaxID=97359 RepID=A0A550C523_9AGAR|nr:glycoside hydrolase family 88 protein [Auriculariopsis ampla]